MVKRWLRRLILWALQQPDAPQTAPGVGTGSTPLFDEWLHGAQTGEEEE